MSARPTLTQHKRILQFIIQSIGIHVKNRRNNYYLHLQTIITDKTNIT